jgi:hypothetical protein
MWLTLPFGHSYLIMVEETTAEIHPLQLGRHCFHPGGIRCLPPYSSI